MAEKSFYRKLGKVVNVVGLTIESAGPDSKLGDLCRILPDAEGARPIMAEVVGFRDKKTLLMPYDSVDGIGLGCVVENTGDALKVTVNDKLLGKTVNGLGVPIDGEMINGAAYPVEAAPPDPMSRTIIDQVLPLGVKAVDGMITVGKGQRIGIFAGSGVGKSTLMGMFARNTKADINVIALIGERGREVREFGITCLHVFLTGGTAEFPFKFRTDTLYIEQRTDFFYFGQPHVRTCFGSSDGNADGPKALDKGGDGSKATVIDGSSCPVHNDTFNSFHTIYYYYSVSRSKELPGRDQRRKRKREESNGPEAFSLR